MKTLFFIVCSLIYGCSLFFAVFNPAEGDSTYILGIIALLFGWGNAQWYANPLLVMAHVYIFKSRYCRSVVFAGLALLLGLSTFLMVEIPRDGSGRITTIVGYELGFYLWLSTLVLTFFGAVTYYLTAKGTKNVAEQVAASDR